MYDTMAYMSTVNFDSLRGRGAGNWETLTRTWPMFLNNMADYWWGSVSLRMIENALWDHNDTGVIVSSYRGDRQGGVCTITWKTSDVIRSCHMVIMQGCFRLATDNITRVSSNTPDMVIDNMLSAVSGDLLCKPNENKEGHDKGCCRTCNEMDVMINNLKPKGAWWGSVGNSRYDSDEQVGVLKGLNTYVTYPPRGNPPAVLVCYTDRWNGSAPGYLFDFVIADGGTQPVMFDKSGYTLYPLHFPTLEAMMSHMETVVTLVPFPVPTLQELNVLRLKDVKQELPCHLTHLDPEEEKKREGP